MPDAQQLAQQILDSVGGAANIADVENCMTHLRVEVVSDSSVSLDELKATDGVMADRGRLEPADRAGPGSHRLGGRRPGGPARVRPAGCGGWILT